jgi:hypothetical protein
MTIDVRLRRSIHQRFEELLGAEEARVLMDHVDPDRGDLARVADLDAVRAALTGDIAEVRTELKTDIAEVRTELGELRTELTDLRTDLDHRFEVMQLRFTADLHKEVGVAMAHQTETMASYARTLIIGVVGAVIANGGLAFAAARLA